MQSLIQTAELASLFVLQAADVTSYTNGSPELHEVFSTSALNFAFKTTSNLASFLSESSSGIRRQKAKYRDLIKCPA